MTEGERARDRQRRRLRGTTLTPSYFVKSLRSSYTELKIEVNFALTATHHRRVATVNKSSVPIALICITNRRIPASTEIRRAPVQATDSKKAIPKSSNPAAFQVDFVVTATHLRRAAMASKLSLPIALICTNHGTEKGDSQNVRPCSVPGGLCAHRDAPQPCGNGIHYGTP